MSSFTEPLLVNIEQGEVEGRGLARLIGKFDYHVGSYPSRWVITVPAGFETDFCSIPRFAMPFFPVLGRAAKAAVVHDYICRRFSRRITAGIFLEAMTVLRVPPLRRRFMYLAVRWFGPNPR